jgi:hypothetical protein
LPKPGHAEQQIREGMPRAARRLPQLRRRAAERRIDRPVCPYYPRPMQRKAYRPCALITTVGPICFRRPSWRCGACRFDCSPHDEETRFLGRAASCPLANGVSRPGAQLPFEGTLNPARGSPGALSRTALPVGAGTTDCLLPFPAASTIATISAWTASRSRHQASITPQ